jgi:diacylglycerol kinase (ATP)
LLAFLMALLVAQSRVEAGIHSALEVTAGAVLGTGLAVLLFQLWG